MNEYKSLYAQTSKPIKSKTSQPSFPFEGNNKQTRRDLQPAAFNPIDWDKARYEYKHGNTELYDLQHMNLKMSNIFSSM